MGDEGYPTLDSISLHTSHQIINTIETITVTKTIKQKQSKWVITPSVGYGYGITNKQPDVFVGITLGYKIF